MGRFCVFFADGKHHGATWTSKKFNKTLDNRGRYFEGEGEGENALKIFCTNSDKKVQSVNCDDSIAKYLFQSERWWENIQPETIEFLGFENKLHKPDLEANR